MKTRIAILMIVLLSPAISLSQEITPEMKQTYKHCANFLRGALHSTTLKDYAPLFVLDQDKGIVTDDKALAAAKRKTFKSEIAVTIQRNTDPNSISILQIDDLGGDPRQFKVSENSSAMVDGELLQTSNKAEFEIRVGKCFPVKAEAYSPKNSNYVKVFETDECLKDSSLMSCKFVPNLADLKKDFAPTQGAAPAKPKLTVD